MTVVVAVAALRAAGAGLSPGSIRALLRPPSPARRAEEDSPMAAKKILTGCLVVVLVAVSRWARRGGSSCGRCGARASICGRRENWATTLDLGNEITNDAPFAPPADGRLTPEQVDALLRVQAVISREMGARPRGAGRARARRAGRARTATSRPRCRTCPPPPASCPRLMSRLRRRRRPPASTRPGCRVSSTPSCASRRWRRCRCWWTCAAMPGVPGLPGRRAGPPTPRRWRAPSTTPSCSARTCRCWRSTLRVRPSSR